MTSYSAQKNLDHHLQFDNEKMHFALNTFNRKGHSEMDKCTQKHHHLQQLHCSTTYVPCSLFYPADTQTLSALTKPVVTVNASITASSFIVIVDFSDLQMLPPKL